MTKEIVKEQKEVQSLDSILENHNIVLFNDDVNSFDHVINSLVKYCKHSAVQAEQCAWIIHSKGKYAVKGGSLPRLSPMREALTDRGIGATVEE